MCKIGSKCGRLLLKTGRPGNLPAFQHQVVTECETQSVGNRDISLSAWNLFTAFSGIPNA